MNLCVFIPQLEHFYYMIGAIRLPRIFQHRLLDVKFGFALMRDHRVPLRAKVAATVLGLGITGLVEVLELPVEGILSMLLPILGAAGDVVMDGAELIAGPLLLASILLPFIAPRHIVDRIRSERATGAQKAPIIEI
jgi:hypothetical protein